MSPRPSHTSTASFAMRCSRSARAAVCAAKSRGMASICGVLEAQAKTGGLDPATSGMLSRIDAEFARVREALESELRS